MLNAEENEVLTQVGPGTPMGSLLRRYWLPALLSEEVPEPDGAPVEVRLLGEDLVAFRDSDGAVGLLQQRCPHRGASLSYGRNEDGGLRCIYHGWKFDVAGRCMDLPTEPEGSPFQDKLRATSYATKEVAGIVWTYMGPAEDVPAFPMHHWLELWPDRAKEWKVLEECNFVQAIEGGIDSAHVGFLHRRISTAERNLNIRDTAPRLQLEYTTYGFRYGALRDIGDDRLYVRVTPYIMPAATVVPPGNLGHETDGSRVVNIWAPRDDVSTWHYQYLYNPEGPIDVEGRIQEAGLWLDDDYRKLRNHSNRYLQDRDEMRFGDNYSGVEGIVTEDHMANESQGKILDRTREHLGTSDIAVLAMRRMLLNSAQRLVEQDVPPASLNPDVAFNEITSQARVISAQEDWREAIPIDSSLTLEGPVETGA